MAKKVNPPVEPTKATKKVMSGFGKKSYAGLIKKYGKDYMSKLAKKGWKIRKAKKAAEEKAKEAKAQKRREARKR